MIAANKQRQHKPGGGFAKGHTLNSNDVGRATGKQLKQLCIDVLNEQGPSGRKLITEVIRNVARDKPEALLPFAGKLIPQETEVTTTKFSPIVLTNDIQPVEGVVVEQTVIASNVSGVEDEEVEPVVLEAKPIKRKKRVTKSKVLIDEEL